MTTKQRRISYSHILNKSVYYSINIKQPVKILNSLVTQYGHFKILNKVILLLLYIFETHPTRRHPTRRNDELTRRAWNQRGAAQVIKYEIYI